MLLEAFSKLQARLPLVAEEFRLVMAGPRDSQFAEDLQGRAQRLGIASGVYWTGMLSGDLKWGAFHAAELFILPSHQENFGISVAESLACGVPVIISDKVNIWREIDQAQAGLICRDTAPSTEQSLESWVALDSGGRHRLQSNARSCFQEHFESRKAATSLLTLFQKLLESK